MQENLDKIRPIFRGGENLTTAQTLPSKRMVTVSERFGLSRMHCCLEIRNGTGATVMYALYVPGTHKRYLCFDRNDILVGRYRFLSTVKKKFKKLAGKHLSHFTLDEVVEYKLKPSLLRRMTERLNSRKKKTKAKEVKPPEPDLPL